MMIVQSVLFFILGVVTTAFIVMLLAPVVWRRAMALSYKVARAQVPLFLTEVEADRDFLRAQHAVDLCSLEEKLKAEQDTHLQRRIRLDSAQERIHALASFEPLCAELKSKLEKSERLAHDLQQKLEKREQQLEQLSGLKPHYEAQKKQLQEQQRKMIRLESSHEKLKEKCKAAVKIDQHILKAFREDIKLLAATVAVEAAKEEGVSSPIVKLAANAADDKSLASSIHRLSQKAAMKPAGKTHHPEKRQNRSHLHRQG